MKLLKTIGPPAPGGLFSVCLAFALFASTSWAATELQTLAGASIVGELLAVTPQGVVIKTAEREVSTPIDQVLQVIVGPVSPPTESFIEVELVDGSILACSSLAIVGESVQLKLKNGVSVSTPLATVATMFRNAQDAAVRQEWTALLRKRGQLDMLVVRSDGRLDALDGTFGHGATDGEAIEFALASGDKKISPKLARVDGLIFVRKPDPNARAALCRVVDSAGNSLAARAVNLGKNGVTIELVSGGKATYPGVDKLAKLDFSKGKLTYLSDLDPIDKDESSTEDLVFPFRRDRNLFGGQLRLKNASFDKGLALHSRTALTYDIGGEYKEFRAMVGVDDVVRAENGPSVHAVVTIEGDGRELLRSEIRSRDEPKNIAVDVKGVRRLRITVASPGLDLGNQVDFCDARVSK